MEVLVGGVLELDQPDVLVAGPVELLLLLGNHFGHLLPYRLEILVPAL